MQPKLLWVKTWMNSSDPRLIGRWYIEHLYKTRTILYMLRIDRGFDTGEMAAIDAYIRQEHGDMDSADTVIYGLSTENHASIKDQPIVCYILCHFSLCCELQFFICSSISYDVPVITSDLCWIWIVVRPITGNPKPLKSRRAELA